MDVSLVLRYPVEAQYKLHDVWSVDHSQSAKRHQSDHDDYGNGFLVHLIYSLVISIRMRGLHEQLGGQPGLRVPG
jgi:hypothetical protein